MGINSGFKGLSTETFKNETALHAHTKIAVSGIQCHVVGYKHTSNIRSSDRGSRYLSVQSSGLNRRLLLAEATVQS